MTQKDPAACSKGKVIALVPAVARGGSAVQFVATSNGSAAAPAFRGTDANTGMYFDGAGQLVLVSNGSRTLVVDSSTAVLCSPNEATFVQVADGTVTIDGAVISPRVYEFDVTSDQAMSVGVSASLTKNTGASGEVILTLPQLTPGNAASTAGTTYTFYVTANQFLRIAAASGDKIRLNASLSAAGGYVRSNTIGDSVTLVADSDAVTWLATSIVGTVAGTWTIDS